MSTFKPKDNGLDLPTHLLHTDNADTTGYSALATPVYRGSSIFFKNTAEQRREHDPLALSYTYGIRDNPTQFTLAKKLAEIEGAQHALVCPSGLSAIALVAQACLKTGDHWCIPDNAYGPVHALAHSLQQDYGIEFSVYESTLVESLKAAVKTNTRLIWTESPGSLTFEVPDLRAIVALAQTLGIPTGIDNTWSAGIALKPFELGLDFSIQALTKYQCGHADVLLGAVLSNNSRLFAAVERKNRLYGLGVSPEDCSLVLRGLYTLPLRFEAQAKTALDLAHWLSLHPAVKTVLHPALPSCPGHAWFKRDFTGAASVFAVTLHQRFSDADACAVIDRLKLFRIAYSWGGPESLGLVVNIPDSRRAHLMSLLGECGPMLRLAVGLETFRDLKADLEQALGVLNPGA
ncbi:MAG TPA: PLP-dependent transferase [Limnobacter sp.]|uniref:PLP-dependent transferase n=1 Tax=Limnobacter sp. TaxID=2003368 RepID=UPI002EDA09B0